MSAPTLIDNLNQIASIKSDIKSAIENKGVDMTGLSFADYPGAISSIQTGGTFVTETLNVSVNNTYYPGQGVDGFSQVVVNVPQVVTGFTEKEITEGNINIVNLNNSASFVASSAFIGDTNIHTIYLPNCKTINNDAFNNCTQLSEFNLPELSYCGKRAFKNTLVQSIYLPNCSFLDDGAFENCYVLTDINIPLCNRLGNSVFQGCRELSIVSLDVSVFGIHTFRNCSSLTSVYLQNCSTTTDGMFANDRNLVDISLPNCGYIYDYTFISCYTLPSITLEQCSQIGNYAFNYCSSLSEITIKYSSVCTNRNGNLFNGCSSLTAIYVPSSLVDAYKSAPNWSFYSSMIFPISE